MTSRPNFRCYIDTAGLFKVTGSYIHCKVINISEMMEDVITRKNSPNRGLRSSSHLDPDLG